ncbi:MAG: hypothetical protein Q4C87_00845 [Actinomycetaceae bacterium]|nr:hypothetical protein [Actinomycetaceae bacterium]
MARILLFVIWIALTIYAVADWARTPENEIPGRIPKPMWLAIIIFTAPTFSIGAIVWIVLRLVAAAEAGNSSTGSSPRSGGGSASPLPSLTDLFPGAGGGRKSSQAKSGAPDDDPDFLFQLQREIHRKRTKEAKKAERSGASSPMNEGGASSEATAPGESAVSSPTSAASTHPGADSASPTSAPADSDAEPHSRDQSTDPDQGSDTLDNGQ